MAHCGFLSSIFYHVSCLYHGYSMTWLTSICFPIRLYLVSVVPVTLRPI
jgi:hypothetical protein